VRITRPFYLGGYEVTQEEYQRVMAWNPSEFSPTGLHKDLAPGQDMKRYPVDHVSWDDAAEFCRKLSDLPEEKAAGRSYRLPSEAQWEYACRAGSTGRFTFSLGGSAISREAEERELLDYGWFVGNAGGITHPVGLKRANAWGLYDMHGNVWEWCDDRYDKEYYTSSPPDDPGGPGGGPTRVARGGGWYFPAWRCRSAFRGGVGPGRKDLDWGFRVAMGLANK
jgi:formylglycine-generating enzyme required for sulfatase activity